MVLKMAYFLKQSHLKKGIYLQIYFSYRDKEKKQTRHLCYKTLGYLQNLIDSGIEDPIAYYSKEVQKLNDDFHLAKLKDSNRLISDESPECYLGYFPAQSIYRRLELKMDIDLLGKANGISYSLSDCFEKLIYARLVRPVSKLKTVYEVFPQFWDKVLFNYDQVLSCTEIIGQNYEKIVEILTHHTHKTYLLDISTVYFDCTNYYFEIDTEDFLRRKGPSKENRKEPIIGMGLLLDANCIPIGCRLYPGNQSEKSILREAIDDMKKQQGITGRTIQVADKGLNCAANILDALQRRDGYIFSKSIKQLPQSERAVALEFKNFVDVKDSKGNLKYSFKEWTDTYIYSFKDENGRNHKIETKEKRIVIFNPILRKKQISEINKLFSKADYYLRIKAKKDQYGEASKYVKFEVLTKDGKKSKDKIGVSLNRKALEKDLDCAGYNMLITSETKMSAQEVWETYHHLWRIEESFRCLKSQLEARPVYLQTYDRILGHFMICYGAIVLERLFQFKLLENRFSSEEVYDFMRSFKITRGESGSNINTSRISDVIKFLTKKMNLPLTKFYLSDKEIERILSR